MTKTSPDAFCKKVFGEYLNEVNSDKAIHVGQYMGRGVIEHLPGNVTLIEGVAGSLENYIVDNIEHIEFVSELSDPVFNRPIKDNFYGSEEEEIIIQKHYDALVLHRFGSVPVRI